MQTNYKLRIRNLSGRLSPMGAVSLSTLLMAFQDKALMLRRCWMILFIPFHFFSSLLALVWYWSFAWQFACVHPLWPGRACIQPWPNLSNEGGSTLAWLKVNVRTPVSLLAQHSLSLPVRYVVINFLVLPSPAPCTSLLSISSMALCRQVWQDSMATCLIKFQAHANSSYQVLSMLLVSPCTPKLGCNKINQSVLHWAVGNSFERACSTTQGSSPR